MSFWTITLRLNRYNDMETPELKDYRKEMDRFYNEIARKNKRISRAIKSVLGQKYWEDIADCLSECEADTAPFSIVREPNGDEQDWNCVSFDNTWVDQRSVGMEGDSFEGTVCIPLDEKRWFKFHYSM